MRTVTYGGAVSLDGYLAGPNGEIDWLHFSKDVQEITAKFWKDVDTILMGRKTYDVSVATHGGGKSKAKSGGVEKKRETTTAKMKTYVFSRTLKETGDPSVELVRGDAAEFVRELKGKPGGKICLMGGGELATSLIAAGLVDEIGLNIQPILLGAGIPTFREIGKRVKLELTGCREIEGGCVMANYRVAGGG